MTSTASFLLAVYDTENPLQCSLASVVILVAANANSPEFDVCVYSFTVCENQSAGMFVGQVSAINSDGHNRGNVCCMQLTVTSCLPFAWSSSEELSLELGSQCVNFELGKFSDSMVTPLKKWENSLL